MNKSKSKYFNTAVKMDLALISLLKKKPFEYITVSELCKFAGVNRSTFYLHYETIGDLLEETAEYLINEFFSFFKIDSAEFILNLSNVKPDNLVFICDEYLNPYLTYIKDNKEIFSAALLNAKTLGFEKLYNNLFEKIFNPILEIFNYPPDDRKFVMMYYLNGITAIVTEWLSGNCEKSISEVSKIIQNCVFGLYKTKI